MAQAKKDVSLPERCGRDDEARRVLLDLLGGACVRGQKQRERRRLLSTFLSCLSRACLGKRERFSSSTGGAKAKRFSHLTPPAESLPVMSATPDRTTSSGHASQKSLSQHPKEATRGSSTQGRGRPWPRQFCGSAMDCHVVCACSRMNVDPPSEDYSRRASSSR
jgi:hypothetical protein